MQTSGYSGTPLAKKLGIKAGHTIALIQPPDHYFQLFPDFPAEVTITEETSVKKNLIHFFTEHADELFEHLPELKDQILQNGMIWVSWPKKASKVPTDMTEDTIREAAFANGLVDVKVCAVDKTWSGLKLVIPKKDRK